MLAQSQRLAFASWVVLISLEARHLISCHFSSLLLVCQDSNLPIISVFVEGSQVVALPGPLQSDPGHKFGMSISPRDSASHCVQALHSQGMSGSDTTSIAQEDTDARQTRLCTDDDVAGSTFEGVSCSAPHLLSGW